MMLCLGFVRFGSITITGCFSCLCFDAPKEKEKKQTKREDDMRSKRGEETKMSQQFMAVKQLCPPNV